ncbi:MAG: peptidylprolyl isomerase, partial [Spongiibacteraceae bacterium]
RAVDLVKPVDPAAVRAEYDKFAAGFKPFTERRAAHILVEINDKRGDAEALTLAQDIAKKIAGGEKFESAAAAYSDDTGSKEEGGDLGGSRGDSFPPAFEAALAALKIGEVSSPVKSDAGYHLIKLLDQHTDTLPSFEARKAEIEQQLASADAQPQLLKLVEKLRDQVFNAEGLSGPAKDNQLTLKESDWIDRKSTDPLLGDTKVQAAAFSNEVLKDGNNSDVIELTPEHYIVLRVKAHEVATPRPVEEVKPQIAATLKQARAVAAARQQAEQLKAQVQQGGDLQKIAQAAGYKTDLVADATRNASAANTEITRFAFNLGRPVGGKPVVDVAAIGNGDVAVLQLLAVKVGSKDSLNDTQRIGLVKQLEQMSGMAGFVAYMDSLRKTAKIERQGE